MSLFDSVFSNKAIMNAALGKLGGVMKSEGLEFIVVSLDPEDGCILVDMYKPREATIIKNDLGATSVKADENLINSPENTAIDAKD
jgi:hypothetical protein